jgi:LacI family transcriptional regulator
MTIKELAKLANTSTATVSLVLNGKWQKMVRPDIAKKVQELSKQHNFTLNIAGRSLVMQRNFRVAVCAGSSLIDHPVMGAYSFHEQLGIISAELSKSSYSIDIIRQDNYENEIEGLGCRLQSNCDGVIFLSPVASKIKPLLEKLALKMPYVVVDSDLKNRSFNYIYTDMTSSVKNIITSLIKKGHKRIGIIRGESSNERFEQKLDGYKKALSLSKIKYLPEFVLADYLEDSFLKGYLAAKKILAMQKPPTAIFCTDNCCGIGFIQYANKNKINIPGDIELVGFGDEAISMFSTPRLTYLKRPVREMAKKAVEILLEWIEGKNGYEPLRYEFKEELIIQETAFFKV